jgi:DNA-binding response OmpR family regulator
VIKGDYMKILIADDSPVSLTFLQKILERLGHQVISCTDGEAAWKIIQQEDSLDAAILDWDMPGISGLDLCRKMRAEKMNHYVLFLTAKDDPEDIAAGIEAGTDDYICKPFRQEDLELKLRSCQRIITLRHQLKDAGIEPQG